MIADFVQGLPFLVYFFCLNGLGKEKTTTSTAETFLMERSKISSPALTGEFLTGILEL